MGEKYSTSNGKFGADFPQLTISKLNFIILSELASGSIYDEV